MNVCVLYCHYIKFKHWIWSVHRATSGVSGTDRLKDEHTLIVEWWAAPGWPNSTTTAAPKCPSRPPVDHQFASKEAEIHKRAHTKTHIRLLQNSVIIMDRKSNLTVPTWSTAYLYRNSVCPKGGITEAHTGFNYLACLVVFCSFWILRRNSRKERELIADVVKSPTPCIITCCIWLFCCCAYSEDTGKNWIHLVELSKLSCTCWAFHLYTYSVASSHKKRFPVWVQWWKKKIQTLVFPQEAATSKDKNASHYSQGRKQSASRIPLRALRGKWQKSNIKNTTNTGTERQLFVSTERSLCEAHVHELSLLSASGSRQDSTSLLLHQNAEWGLVSGACWIRLYFSLSYETSICHCLHCCHLLRRMCLQLVTFLGPLIANCFKYMIKARDRLIRPLCFPLSTETSL